MIRVSVRIVRMFRFSVRVVRMKNIIIQLRMPV